MTYSFLCHQCGTTHDAHAPAGQAPATMICPDCAGQAKRQYRLNLIVPEGFSSWYPRDPLTGEARTAGERYGQSYAQAKEQERVNEEYARSKPRTPPGQKGFEDYYREELRGS